MKYYKLILTVNRYIGLGSHDFESYLKSREDIELADLGHEEKFVIRLEEITEKEFNKIAENKKAPLYGGIEN